MPGKFKAFRVVSHAPTVAVAVLDRPGMELPVQVELIVCATSRVSAVEAFKAAGIHVTAAQMRAYGSVTSNVAAVAALANHDPGTVMVSALQVHDYQVLTPDPPQEQPAPAPAPVEAAGSDYDGLSAVMVMLVGLRRQSGLTQRDVAWRMGVGQPTVCQLETARRRNPGVVTVDRYARAIGYDLRWYLLPTGETEL